MLHSVGFLGETKIIILFAFVHHDQIIAENITYTICSMRVQMGLTVS